MSDYELDDGTTVRVTNEGPRVERKVQHIKEPALGGDEPSGVIRINKDKAEVEEVKHKFGDEVASILEEELEE